MGIPDAGRPTWAEVDLAALVRNYERLRARSPGRRVIGVVKANAYGHGSAPVSRALVEAGCERLAVASAEEAREIAAAGIDAPILLLEGLHAPALADEVLAQGWVCAVGRADQLEPLEAAARRAGRRCPIHVKFDTGMRRLGFPSADAAEVLGRVAASPDLEIEGVMSHLATADDAASPALAVQRVAFADVLCAARDRGIEPGWIHMDGSPGVLHGPTDGTNAIRPGLALYGADPTLEGGAELDPVMTLLTRAIHAQDLSAGDAVGYGGAFVAPRATRLLTLPLGYADGLPRAAGGGRAELLLRGVCVPVVGRVSMDLSTVDAGAVPTADAGDELVVFGRRGANRLPVEALARAVGTLAYEIFVRIGPRVPRVYV